MNKIIKLIALMNSPKLLKVLLSHASHGYLKETGWINSYTSSMPIDKDDNPLPWVTYSFIRFIESRLSKEMRIFEYGSGNSTNYYANKVHSVTSVEHDENWYKEVSKKMPDNVTLLYESLVSDSEYSRKPQKQNEKYHLISVDGRDRVNCLKNSLNALTDNGVIILDDSDREKYIDGYTHLTDKGFSAIDFWGISPGLFYNKATTVFYKKDNCLNI